MLTDQELGMLVVKVQNDDVRPHELRDFLLAVTRDAEMRSNLKLAGKVSRLDQPVRAKNCRANMLYLLTHSTLAPDGPPERIPGRSTTRAFANEFSVVCIGAWKEHVIAEVPSSSRNPPNSKTPNKPGLLLSEELRALLVALEEFWDVRGLYIT